MVDKNRQSVVSIFHRFGGATRWLQSYENFWTHRLDALDRLAQADDATLNDPQRRRPMNDHATLDAFGTVTEPSTLTIRRLLPGPIERIWSYLTDSDMRRKWLAAGDMDMSVGAPFEFVWRNDELSATPGSRPEGFPEEQRMESRITELDPPNRISFTWQGSGDVTFDLEPRGKQVLLTVIHRSLPASSKLGISAGWHMHLDILAARAEGKEPTSFWEGWTELRKEYERRLQA